MREDVRILHLGFGTGTTLKDTTFIASYLRTHQLIIREGGYGIYMGLEYFFKRRVILEGGNIFSKFHSPPCQCRSCSALSLIDRLTHPQHTPARPKAECLENENEAKSRCQRVHQKVCQWLHHGHAIGIGNWSKDTAPIICRSFNFHQKKGQK